jgi:hypothetical protein
MRISIFILKDTFEQAQKSVSDVQCSYTVVTDSREVNPREIVADVVGDRRYRTRISY